MDKSVVNEFDVHELEDRIEFGVCGGGGVGSVCNEDPDACHED